MIHITKNVSHIYLLKMLYLSYHIKTFYLSKNTKIHTINYQFIYQMSHINAIKKSNQDNFLFYIIYHQIKNHKVFINSHLQLKYLEYYITILLQHF